MTKSQNAKDEQQKDLCITSEQLTELWNKGKLIDDSCYVKSLWTDEIDIKYVYNGVDDCHEIIAPVPSYEQWQAKLEENTKLKELLKECIIYVDRYVAFSVVQGNEERKVKSKELLTKINQVLGEE